MEIYRGFVFARIQGGGPSVAQMLAPYADEIAPHEFEALEPIGRVTLRPRTVNWKNVGDNYSDALHIPVAHPGLTRLFGASYRVESREWVDRMSGDVSDKPSRNWAERAYQKFLPAAENLPPDKRRSWVYFKLWPNFAFDVYPDQVDIMQWIPISPTQTLIREIGYARPDARREMRAARYCNWRINRQVNAEDAVLIQRVQDGMVSGSYRIGPLADGEVALRSFGRRLRQLIPRCADPAPPGAGWSLATAGS
jgi:phenylpropionate dioxygenase-like ring-hydroxylating dioxygenase large terminal subunit